MNYIPRFFNHLNVVFSFVAQDLIDKFDFLEHLNNEHPTEYHSAQSMIEHERNLSDKAGTTALLRLLRALEFTYFFLERAVVSQTETAHSKHIAWDVYKQTLHRRHHKAVRMSIWCATATIPKRDNLRQTLLRGQIEPDTDKKCFPKIEQVFRHIYQLYEQNNLLELVPL